MDSSKMLDMALCLLLVLLWSLTYWYWGIGLFQFISGEWDLVFIFPWIIFLAIFVGGSSLATMLWKLLRDGE